MTEKLAYRVDELARATGMSRSTIYRDMESGRLQFVQRGRVRLVLHADAQAYLESLRPVA